MTILDMLSHREPIIFDGAMGTELEKLDLSPRDYQGTEGCKEVLNVSRPDLVEHVHAMYLEAGANITETNTFGGNRFKLDEYGLGDRVAELNRAGAEAARKAVEGCKVDYPLFVCGSMGPTGILCSSSDPQLARAGFDQVADVFAEQARALIEGGVDVLLLETMQDLLEVRAAMYGVFRAFDELERSVPLQVQATMDMSGHMLMGSDVKAFLGAVIGMGPTAVGLNCSTGPNEMAPIIKEFCSASPVPVSMIPNAGLPENVDGKAVYRMEPRDFAASIADLVEHQGVAIVGGCCGTTPAHIQAVAEVLRGKKKVAARSISHPHPVFLGTGISGTEISALSSPVIIGERLNAQGSRKTKKHLLADNWDELNSIAQKQVDSGAHIIDICVAVNELPDEVATMTTAVRFLSERLGTPFSVDSTDPEVIGAALKNCPGSLLINSINLEHGEQRATEVLALARKFGCSLIALTIDEQGMAKTAAAKVDCTRRIREVASAQGVPDERLWIDPLVFTLATGDPETADAANESLQALRRIKKEFPQIRTAMGVSNVSFGLSPKARRILNNLMLHHAVEAGLDGAIFNPMHRDDIAAYEPHIREAGEDLLFNRRADALERFVALFPATPRTETSKTVETATEISPADRLHAMVLDRSRTGLPELIEALLSDAPPEDILNKILLPAMAEVGDKMARGEMILPFVLQAAEVMRDAVTILEPHLKKAGGSNRGKLLLATVYGDVHDIGKNLVGSILRNQGFEVIDLGKQVPLSSIVEAVEREKPDAVGLSALLVTTSKEMEKCVAEFRDRGYTIPILIGGAAVNSAFAERIARDEVGTPYTGGVHYAKDAFAASRILDRVRVGETQPSSAKPEVAREGTVVDEQDVSIEAPELSHQVIVPMYYGTSEILRWDAETVLAGIDSDRLFKGYWRGGNLPKDQYARTRETEFEPALERLSKELRGANLLSCAGLYGIFPVITDDTEVIILDPGDFHTELGSFSFPRVEKQGRSVADYFRREGDVVAIQVVTLGPDIDQRCEEYFSKEDKYSEGFYLNGIGDFLTEQLAERLTTEIRRAFRVLDSQGRRFSFGYPGLPGIEHQARLFELLGVEERLGITLTEGFQMVPQHSTMGIYVHHLEARYL